MYACTQETPLPVDPSMFPTWPAKSELAALKKDKTKEKSPTAPEGGAFLNQVKVNILIFFFKTGCLCLFHRKMIWLGGFDWQQQCMGRQLLAKDSVYDSDYCPNTCTQMYTIMYIYVKMLFKNVINTTEWIIESFSIMLQGSQWYCSIWLLMLHSDLRPSHADNIVLDFFWLIGW